MNCYCYPNPGVSVTISTTTANAQIRWTNDGTEPTASNPSTHLSNSSSAAASGTSYTSVRFRAVAIKAGMTDSDEAEETFYYDSGGPGGNLPEQQPGEGGDAPWPTYDDNGNLKTYKGWTYTYDAQNRLKRASNGATTAEFYYDGKNRQIVRNVGGIIRFSAWDNWELLEEYSSGLNVVAGYLQGSTGVIKSWGGANGTIYYYQDKLGS